MKTFLAEFLKIFSIVAFLLFAAILVIALFLRFDPQAKDIAMLILGGTISQLTSIVGYWFGSSKGSADKTEMLRNQNGGTP